MTTGRMQQNAQALTHPLPWILCLGIVASMTVACSLPGREAAPATQAYVLQAAPVPAVAAGDARACLTLRVGTPRAAPGFTSSRMAYVNQSQQLDYFAYNEWVDTPASMLALALEKRIDEMAIFGAVLSGSAEIKTDLRLDSYLLALQQDFTGKGSTVVLEVKIKLIDVAGRTLLGTKTFSYAEPAGGENPAAGVAAANRAMDRFLADLTGFLKQSVSGLECPPPA